MRLSRNQVFGALILMLIILILTGIRAMFGRL